MTELMTKGNRRETEKDDGRKIQEQAPTLEKTKKPEEKPRDDGPGSTC